MPKKNGNKGRKTKSRPFGKVKKPSVPKIFKKKTKPPQSSGIDTGRDKLPHEEE